MVDIYRAAKRRGKYPPLFTNADLKMMNESSKRHSKLPSLIFTLNSECANYSPLESMILFLLFCQNKGLVVYLPRLNNR